MPVIEINVNNKPYQISCDIGQENHLKELSFHLEHSLNELSKKFPKASDSYLLLLQCLTMQDQIEELSKNNHDDIMAQSINSIAEYVENLALKIENLYNGQR